MAREKRDNNLIDIIVDYEEYKCGSPYEFSELIQWAIETGRMDAPSPESLREEWIARQSRELQQAACREHHRDGKGRRVRSFYSTKVIAEENGKPVQKHLWNSRHNATWEFKVAAVDSRLSQVVGDAIALQTDVESLNEFDRPKGRPSIQLHWDFRSAVSGADQTRGKTG